jgi:uncharacterized protein DUF1844
MDEEQPTFKVVDRRPFNPDGTPRDLPPEEKTESTREADSSILFGEKTQPDQLLAQEPTAERTAPPREAAQREFQTGTGGTDRPKQSERPRAAADPLEDPSSFLSLIMSLASNAAASLGMMPHPVTGESGVDLKTAKHWIDVLGMLEQKTRGNLDTQEEQVLEGLLADLRMQYVSLTSSPAPPAKFSASDITGGK